MTTTAVGVVVPPLLSLLLRRHRIGEIDPDTVASLLIHLLWDRLDSGRYRGPPLVQVLRRHHRSDRLRARDLANLALIDLECHTLLTLCQPPPGKPLGAVHLDELDLTSAFDWYEDALRNELDVFCRACAERLL